MNIRQIEQRWREIDSELRSAEWTRSGRSAYSMRTVLVIYRFHQSQCSI